MTKKSTFRELIARSKKGDQEAMTLLVQRLTPLVRKHSRRLGYDEAYNDLILWLVNAVHHYRPNTTWGENELKQYLSKKRDNEQT